MNAILPFVYHFLFLRSFYLFITSRLRVFSLPILRSTLFIPRNQSYARRCYRISKFLEENGDSSRRQTNEDEWLNMISLSPTGKHGTCRGNKIYPVQNALRNAPDVLSTTTQHRGRLSLLLRWILFSNSAGTRGKDHTLRTHSSVRPHRSWRFDFTGHEFRKARRHAVNL